MDDRICISNFNTLSVQVLRQTTLPIVPTRHQTFQRQLSHRLEMPCAIQFSICSLEQRSNSSIVGLIKVCLIRATILDRMFYMNFLIARAVQEGSGKADFHRQHIRARNGILRKTAFCSALRQGCRRTDSKGKPMKQCLLNKAALGMFRLRFSKRGIYRLKTYLEVVTLTSRFIYYQIGKRSFKLKCTGKT